MHEGNQYGFSISLRTENNNGSDESGGSGSSDNNSDEGPLPYQKRFVLGVNKLRPLYRKIQSTTNTTTKEDHPRDTIPVSILRQFIKKRFPLKWEKTYKYVLCDFKESIEYTKKEVLPYKNITKWMYTNIENLSNEESVMMEEGEPTASRKEQYTYGFSPSVVEDILSQQQQQHEVDDFTIFKSLIARIDAGHKFMSWCIRENNRRLKFCCQLFIDSHLDLSVYITKHCTYRDSELTDPFNNMEYIIRSALDTYYPFEDRFAYFGDLPDMTTCIDMGNLWYDVRPKSKSLISALIHIIACKPLNHKCQWRNFIEILWDYVSKYPVISDLYRLLIEVSLMGNYPYSEVRPSYAHRMDIRKAFGYGSSVDEYYSPSHTVSFSSKQLITDNELFLWMTENEHIICQITTEYYMYNVVMQHALDSVLEYYDHWKHVKQLIRKGTDIIRREITNFDVIASPITTFTSCFESTKRELQLIHQKTLVYISKLKKTGFIDIMITELNKYNERNVINKNSTSPQTSEMYMLENERYREGGGGIDIMKFLNLACEKVASLRTNKIETKWLKCLGMTAKGYDYIRDLYYRYECEDIADNSISKDIDRIFKNSARDFHLIRVYVKNIQKLRSVRSYVLSSDYGINQLKALRAKRCLMWWQPTPDDIDLFYYCSSCKKWSAPVVDSKDEKKRLNYHAMGREKALYDPFTKQLYCGKQTTSISVKKYMDNGTYFSMKDISDTRVAKTIRNHKENLSCNGVPLIGVHMLNACQKLDDKKWALCEICGWITLYEGAKFGPNGFTCGMHESSVKKKPIMFKGKNNNKTATNSQQQTEPQKSQQKGEGGEKEEEDEEDDDDELEEECDIDEEEDLDEVRLKNGLYESSNELDYCIYCGLLCIHDKTRTDSIMGTYFHGQQQKQTDSSSSSSTPSDINNNNNNNDDTAIITSNVAPPPSSAAAVAATKKRKQNMNNVGVFVKIVDDDILKLPSSSSSSDEKKGKKGRDKKNKNEGIKNKKAFKTVCLCHSDYEKVKDFFSVKSITLKSTLFKELANIRSKVIGSPGSSNSNYSSRRRINTTASINRGRMRR